MHRFGDRQPDDELRSLADARAVASTLPAVHLHQALDQREADAEAPLRRVRAGGYLVEHLEHACGSASVRDADPVVRTRTTASPPSRSASRRMCPPRGVYLALLLSRLVMTCATRAGSACSQIGSSGDRQRQRVTGRRDRRATPLLPPRAGPTRESRTRVAVRSCRA